MPTIRQINIAKSKAAGAPVGKYSELVSPGIGKTSKRLRKKQSRRNVAKSKNKKKDIATVKAERDALFGGRRAPGSFENGRR